MRMIRIILKNDFLAIFSPPISPCYLMASMELEKKKC
jgi:hypothetical protein